MLSLKIISFFIFFSLGNSNQISNLIIEKEEITNVAQANVAQANVAQANVAFGFWAPKVKTCPSGQKVIRCDYCPYSDRASQAALCTCGPGDQNLCSYQ